MRSITEQESLKLVKELLKQQVKDSIITESQNQYEHYDLLLEFNGVKAYIEVKERMGKYCEVLNFIKYSELGWMSEQIKWDFLVGKPGRYINLFRVAGEIIIMVWDLNKIQNNAVTLNCPKVTDTSFGKTGNRDKLSTNLLAEQGTIYIKRSDKYETVEWIDLKSELLVKTQTYSL